MKIMVFDVPADSGGALSILEEYYYKAINYPDKNIQWVFVLSKPIFKGTNTVKILDILGLKVGGMAFLRLFVAPSC